MNRTFIILILVIIGFSVMPSQAGINKVVQIQCLEDLNMLKIDVFNADGKIAIESPENNRDELWNKHGIHELSSMIGTIRLKNGDGTPSDDPRDDRMTVINPIDTTCTLMEDQGADGLQLQTYHIHVEPYFFNMNAIEACGGATTFQVSIKSGDKILMDKLPFHYRCRLGISKKDGLENRWEEMIDTISISPDKKRISIQGSYMKLEEAEFINAFETYKLDEDTPLTA